MQTINRSLESLVAVVPVRAFGYAIFFGALAYGGWLLLMSAASMFGGF